MTRCESGQFGSFLKRAVLGAALFFCVPQSILAQDVTLRSQGGGLEVTGRFIGYDGENIQISSDYGAVTLRYSTVNCSGDACPDAENFVPNIRISGAARMAAVLLPGLVQGFARSQGFRVTSTEGDASHFAQTLSEDENPVATFSFRVTSTDEGFADLIAYEADIVSSVREVHEREVQRAADAGLGQLDDARQSRIVGLDALVPVVPPQSERMDISLFDLARIYAGEVTNWNEIGGIDLTITPHLGAVTDGAAQRFVDQVVRAAGYELGGTVIRHATADDLSKAVTSDVGAIGVLPFTSIGNTRAIALRDTCGFITTPDLTTLKTEDYPLTAPLFLYLPSRRMHPVVREFLAWLRGPQAQLVVRRSGFVDQGAIPIALNKQGQRFVNAIASAGDEMPLIELQRMVRVLAAQVRLSTSFRFEVGSTRLDAQSRSNLLTLGQAIKDGEYTGRTLMLVGFSDGRGAAKANRELSAARAEAVLRELRVVIGGAIPSDVTVETEAFGEALPMGCDDTEWGRQMNRRVELWIDQ